MKRKSLMAIIISSIMLLSYCMNAFAGIVTPQVDYPDITSSFSQKMISNAANIAYYAQVEKGQGTYPLATGEYFASKVKSGGAWDYKRTYGTSSLYYFKGNIKSGEDLGNMHYGYVGRAAGFSSTILKTAAGAYQIYSGTSYIGWYNSYFDDPRDQTQITYGISLWDNNTLRSISMSAESLIPTLSDEEKEKIKQQVIEDVKKIKEKQKNKE